jgi:hypothetical protein
MNAKQEGHDYQVSNCENQDSFQGRHQEFFCTHQITSEDAGNALARLIISQGRESAQQLALHGTARFSAWLESTNLNAEPHGI